MFSIKTCPVPANTLLDRYSTNGAYTDCYWTEVPGEISFPEYIFTFYTTPLFKLERSILKLFVAKPSTDIQARQLANGVSKNFAAWYVEDRNEDQMLLCDFIGRTRSWLKVAALSTAGDVGTRLYFGSAVVRECSPKTGKLSLGFGYQALLGYHKVYSVLLLYAAKSRIVRQRLRKARVVLP